MFNKILIVCRDDFSEDCAEIVRKIKLFAPDKSFFVISSEEMNKSNLNGIDLVITIGGDGTFLKAAHLVDETFILGINPHPETSEGFLTSITKYEIDKIKDILDGKFKVIEKQRAKITRNGEVLDELALNEVYVGAKLNFHSSRYILKFKGKQEEHRSAGVIISTGTGSTAWYRSVGGEPFHHGEKKLKFLIREPYHGKIYCPSILNGEINEGEKIVIESRRDSGGVVAIGNTYYDFNKGDIVEISLSEKPLNVIVKADNQENEGN